jgi:hypothetical protein
MARPDCRIPRPGRSAFAGWGGVVGELMEQQVAAHTLEIRQRPRARRARLA